MFRNALRLNPAYTEAALNLVVTCNDLGKYGEAKTIYEQAMAAVKQRAARARSVRQRQDRQHARRDGRHLPRRRPSTRRSASTSGRWRSARRSPTSAPSSARRCARWASCRPPSASSSWSAPSSRATRQAASTSGSATTPPAGTRTRRRNGGRCWRPTRPTPRRGCTWRCWTEPARRRTSAVEQLKRTVTGSRATRADLHLHARHVHRRGDPRLRPQRRRDPPFLWIEKRGLTTFDAIARLARGARPRAARHRLRRPEGSARADPAVAEPARSRRRGARAGDRGRRPQGAAGGPAPAQAAARPPARQPVRGDVDGRGDRGRARRVPRPVRGAGASGVPNRFGAQRFGAGGDNAAVGLALLRGERRERDKRRRRLLLSALQSAVFNRALELRAASGGLAEVRGGDVLQEDRQRRPVRDRPIRRSISRASIAAR